LEKNLDTRHLVAPDLTHALDRMPPLVLTGITLVSTRHAISEMLAATADIEVPGVATTTTTVPVPGAPDVTVQVSRPSATVPGATVPAVLWMHGGGYVLGSAAQDRLKVEPLSATLGCVFVSVDYRLAPETPHPGPLEDCYAVLRWLHQHADELGVDPTRIAVAGESAGGGLAAALALLARDRGEVPVAFQSLVYPMLDDRTSVDDDRHPFTGEFVWNHDANRFGWTGYLGRDPGTDDVSPYAAPSRAVDLAGLPPAFIAVGALDLFLEEDLEYARRLLRAGVATELHVYPGAYHGFWMAPHASTTAAFARDLSQSLARALGQ
jgi:acetyl esterase/lipase